MASLLYFLAGSRNSIDPDDLHRLGLGHIAQAGVHSVKISGRGGVDGREGILFAAADRLPVDRLAYRPEAQTWAKVPDALWRPDLRPPTSDLSCGYWSDDRPCPADLLRPKALDGHWTELGDGAAWLAPLARGRVPQEDSLPWFNALPRATSLDEDGSWIAGQVLPKYARLWAIAQEWWDVKFGAASAAALEARAGDPVQIRFDFAGLNDAAAECLAANYRLGKAEIALLGLFDGDRAPAVLDALVDWPTVERWAAERKKKADESGPVPAGSPGDGGVPG